MSDTLVLEFWNCLLTEQAPLVSVVHVAEAPPCQVAETTTPPTAA